MDARCFCSEVFIVSLHYSSSHTTAPLKQSGLNLFLGGGIIRSAVPALTTDVRKELRSRYRTCDEMRAHIEFDHD